MKTYSKSRNAMPWLAVLPMIALLAACGGGDDASGTNQQPTANAGTDQVVDARTEVALAGSGTDSDGSIAGYAWSQTAGTAVTLTGANAQSPTFTAPDVESTETLTFKLTVTDDAGNNATDTVAVTVAPAIALTGRIYDGPIPGAVITVTVGDRSYTATADADGVYTVNIGSPDPAAFITITANGAAGQEHVELFSIAGSFGALSEAASTDRTLDATENGNVNVTNLTTAKAVLMIEANGGTVPTDDAGLVELEKSVDSDAMLELATVIKLVVDEGVTLPNGVATTLDLVQDSAVVEGIIETAEADNPGIFETTLNSIISDPDLTTSFTVANVPSAYFVNRKGFYMYANRGFFLTLAEDGSGFLYGDGSSLSSALDWTIGAAGQLQLQFDTPLTQYLNCNTTSGHVTCLQTITVTEITLVAHGAETDTLSIKHTGTVTYPFNPELDDENLSSTYTRLGMRPGSLETFTAADIAGTWSVPLSSPNTLGIGPEYETGLLAFNTDGTGMRQSDSVTFNWSLNTKTGVLNIQFANGDQLDGYYLRPESDVAVDAMLIMKAAGGDIYALPYFVVTDVDTGMAGNLVLSDIDGTWQYTDTLGLSYINNSMAGTATATHYDTAGSITAQYPAGLEFDNIKFDVISWWDITNDLGVSNCSGVSPCFWSYSSSWYPLAIGSDGRVFMREDDRGYNYDSGATGDFYRGAMYYHHSMNRWLQQVSTATSKRQRDGAKPASAKNKRGDRVRRIFGETLVGPAH